MKVAAHNGSLLIQSIDDGAGLNRKIISKKAAELGLISNGELSLSDTELRDIICSPGFTTSETVSEISGRGVGMDIVQTAVQSLRGTLEVSSFLKQGTIFRIRIPMND